jgi:hypothetical protein
MLRVSVLVDCGHCNKYDAGVTFKLWFVFPLFDSYCVLCGVSPKRFVLVALTGLLALFHFLLESCLC